MKKILLIMAMVAMVWWLQGQAMADCYPPPPSFTSSLTGLGTNNLPTSDKETNYGTVVVTLSNPSGSYYTTATVKVTPTESPVDLDFWAAVQGTNPVVALNLNTSYINLSSGTFSSTSSPSGTTLTTNTSTSGISFDSLGKFNVDAVLPSGDNNQEAVTFTISGGSWTSANQVLVANSSGYDAGIYAYVVTGDESPTSYNAYIGEVAAVPLPPTALLLGSGLLGLGLMRWRRFRKV